jgi:hypothetical protein
VAESELGPLALEMVLKEKTPQDLKNAPIYFRENDRFHQKKSIL